jgi:chromosome partitioning protein
MPNIFSIFNQAGGVGKTTLTMNLGYALAQKGQRVLLIDFDPQASLTIFMGLEPDELDFTIYDCLMKRHPIDEVVVPSLHGMDLLPSNIGLGEAELELVAASMREVKLKKAIELVVDNYDVILIDCPPSLGMLSYLSLVTSQAVLVPVDCEFKSYRGTDLLRRTVARVQQDANPTLEIFGFVPTKYSKGKSQHKGCLGAMQEYLSPVAPVFQPIANAIAFVDASMNRQPLALYDRRHEAVNSINELADTICAQLPQGALTHA